MRASGIKVGIGRDKSDIGKHIGGRSKSWGTIGKGTEP